MKQISAISLLLCLLAALVAGFSSGTLAAQSPIPNPQSATFTLSGTLRDPAGSPVPDVEVGISSEYEWDEDTTDDSGFYSVEVTGPTWLRFYIRPPLDTRLAQMNVYKEGPFDSDTVQDFDLVVGYLFSGEVQSPTGDSVYLPWGADIYALTNPPPDDESFDFWTNWRDGTFETVLPPDVYSIVVRDPPRPYYPTRVRVDLRSADVENYDFILNVAPDPLPGIEPPNAALITLGAPNADGYLSVTGAPGAVSPFAAVFIAHMNAGRWTAVVAEEDGSFSATAYGPPGSILLVKQDPSHRYFEAFIEYAEPDPTYSHPVGAANLDPLASTTLQVPMPTVSASRFPQVSSQEKPKGTQGNAGNSGPWPLSGSGIIDPYNGVAMWTVTGEITVEDTMQRVVGGTLNGTFEPGLYVGGVHWIRPALADLDGDGDLDLFIGDHNGYIIYYRNDGLTDSGLRIADLGFLFPPLTIRNPEPVVSEVEPSEIRNVKWTFVTDRWENMDIGWSVAPAFVDIDYDGDQDLLAGTGNGKITFFRNIGTPTTPAWRFVTSEYTDIDVGDNAAPAFADIDADGDYDLFIGNGDGQIVFYRNIGTREEAVWMFVTDSYLGTSVGSLALPALADVDNDGDLDFFVGSSTRLSYWRNDGTPAAPSWTLATYRYAGIYERSYLTPAFADLDQDGDLDLLLGWKYGPIRTYTNLGTPESPLWARTADDVCPLDLGGYSTPALADWDGDGDLDLLVGDYYERVRIFRNEGWAIHQATEVPATFAPSAPLRTGVRRSALASPQWTDMGLVDAVDSDDLYHAAPALVDIDDDGDLDLFVGEDDGGVDFLLNLGSPTDPNWVLAATGYQGFDVGTHAKPTFGDLDGDGDYDLLMGAQDGRLHFYENTGSPTSPSWAAPDHYYGSIDVGRYSAPLLADLDDDLDLDLLVGDEEGRIWAYQNDGDTWTLLTEAYGAARPDDYATPALGDLNGDGRPDLVVGSLAGGLQLYLADGGKQTRGQGDRETGGQGDRLTHPISPSPRLPLSVSPPRALTASGTLRVTSTAFPADFDPATVYLGGNFEPRPFFDADGHPHAATNQFYSTFLTPSGFPVERYASWYNRWATYFEMTDKRLVDDHTLEADFEVTLYLPDDMPAGWYRPTLELSFGSIPGATDETVASIFTSNRPRNLAFGPLVAVGNPVTPHLPWMLLADTFSNATRGTMPIDDGQGSAQGTFQLANRRIYQASTFFVPRSDPRSGKPFTYRLEPFVPFVSVSDHSLPYEPLIPFAFPSGQLHVTVQQPDGTVDDLGTAPFAQSTSRTPVMLNGDHYEGCSGSVGDIYQLITNSGQFDYQFSQYGRHTITMVGTIDDIWGQTYTGGGTYEVWVGREIHVHPGTVPGTPFQVGDTLAPTLRLSPAVPADVTIRLRLYRNSDPADVLDQTITGRANRFGYFAPPSPPTLGGTEEGPPFVFDAPGEYRVDVTAVYTDADGVVWVGSQSWGNVVETPGTRLVAHGRRGIDQSYTRTQWFTRDMTGVEGGHLNFPFASGDVAWATDSDGSAAKVTFHDPDGVLSQALRERAALSYPSYQGPGDIENRITMGETPLFSVASGPNDPAYTLNPIEQWGYTYRVAQRPGMSVHQQVTEDTTHAPIWRFGNRHSSQVGMGMDGERPSDFKWQFGGVVLRDLVEGWNRYAIYGSLWVELPGDDPVGSRVFPPFQGAAGGPSSGPLLTFRGESIDLFIEPTGVKPGAILELGNTFAFAGQVAPPLASRVDVVVTSPGGVVRRIHGRANKVGYFYDPSADFVVDETGVWTADVTVTHDGMTSAGPVDPPYPTGGILGTQSGRYEFYVVDPAQPRMAVNAPVPGWMQMYRDWDVTPTQISVPVPKGWTDAVLHYTIAMPGWVVETGESASTGKAFMLNYDAETLRDTFSNIDLRRRQSWAPGLSDEVFISFLVSGNDGGNAVHRANAVTLHGEQILFEGYAQPEAGQTEFGPPSATALPVNSDPGSDPDKLQHRTDTGDQYLMPKAAPRRTETESRACSGGALSKLRTPCTGQDGRADSHVVYLPLVTVGRGQNQSARPPWCREQVESNCAPPAPEETLYEYREVGPHVDVGRER